MAVEATGHAHWIPSMHIEHVIVVRSALNAARGDVNPKHIEWRR
jgi:hypothetical protein